VGGDEGSAFEIGRPRGGSSGAGQDQAAPITCLPNDSGRARLHGLGRTYRTNDEESDGIFSRAVSVVAEAANAEDSAAKEIPVHIRDRPGESPMIVVRRLGMKDEEFPVVKCGGVFGHSKMLDALLDSVVVSGALRAKVSRLEIPPAVGAAALRPAR